MAPKSGEKKPAQPAKKAVAKKSTGGRKKGSKKAVESYKIYIYKVTHCIGRHSLLFSAQQVPQRLPRFRVAGLEAGPSRHRNLFQGHVHPELIHC